MKDNQNGFNFNLENNKPENHVDCEGSKNILAVSCSYIISQNKKCPFYNFQYLFYYHIKTNLFNVRCTHNRRFMC